MHNTHKAIQNKVKHTRTQTQTNTMMMIPSESNFYTAFSLRVFLFNSFFVFKPLTKQTTADYKDAQTAEFSERKHNKQKQT